MIIMKFKFIFTLLLSWLSSMAIANGNLVHVGPLISGTSSYVKGQWAWTDYAYDDTGMNSDSLAGGDASYPETQRNAADIIQVQFAKVAGNLQVLTILQTLTDADAPEIVVMFDTDKNELTGSSMLSGGAWLPNGSLGSDWMLLINSKGATLSRWSGISWSEQAKLTPAINLIDNTISVAIPPNILNPGKDAWRVFAAAGLASDPILKGGAIYDLAFVVGELVTDRNLIITDSIQSFSTNKSTIWQDHIQASILQGVEPASLAAAVIDFSKIDALTNELSSANTNGPYTFLYKSDLDLGEGIVEGTAGTTRTSFFNGPYQPYLVYHRADTNAAKYPLVVWMHGTGQTHLLNTMLFDPNTGNQYTYPAVTVLPLGRGQALQYEGIGEYDILEVIRDVSARYPIDEDRVVLTGFSMGGIGTYKLAGLYPDRFTTAVALFGTTSSGNLTPLLQNLVNLPLRADNGMIDYLINPALWEPDRIAGLALNYDFQFFDINDSHHSAQPRLENCLFEKAINRTRAINPPRVRYYIEPARFYDDLSTGLKLNYDGAYWVSGMLVRESSENGFIDALSLGRADRSDTTEVIDQQHTASGNDFCGPNPAISTNPGQGSAWRKRAIIRTPGEQQTVENAAQIELSSLSAVSLDINRMALTSELPLRLKITGDGVTELTLLGNWQGTVSLVLDGVKIPAYQAADNGSITLSENFSGTHEYIVGATVNPNSPPLQSTESRSRSGGGAGGLIELGGLAVILCLLLLRKNRKNRIRATNQ
jgi:pimeloyl-ACP methyl ester carboxylesterase